MNYSEQVRKDAKAAGDYIREHGWMQGWYIDGLGRCCMLGARNAAICGEPRPANFVDYDQVRRAQELRSAMMKVIGTQRLPDWNDTPGRTKEEVLAVFDRIAGISTTSDT
jgi:hypothetical protein